MNYLFFGVIKMGDAGTNLPPIKKGLAVKLPQAGLESITAGSIPQTYCIGNKSRLYYSKPNLY